MVQRPLGSPETPKLPRAHLSPITWIGIVAVLLAIALIVVWAIWFAVPTAERWLPG